MFCSFSVLVPLNANHLKHREPLNTYHLKLFGKIVVERARVEKYSQVEKYPTQDYHYRYTEVSKRFCAPQNLNLGGDVAITSSLLWFQFDTRIKYNV